MMTLEELAKRLEPIPRKRFLFTPTPFHKLENFSKTYETDVYMKREELGGPSSFSGNKIRKLEFIIGQALEEGIDSVITYGSYQSNSAMQIATTCNASGIKPILFLGDTKAEGLCDAPSGNLLVNLILGAEIHYVDKPDPKDSLDLNPLWNKVIEACMRKKEAMESEGHKVMFIPVGSTHEYGFVSDVLMFRELMEQSRAEGVELDYLFHTNGSGGTLPGLIAAKLITGSEVQIKSINVRSWEEGELISKSICVDRVKSIYRRLQLTCPPEDVIVREINVDYDYMHPGYGIPNEKAVAAIRELAQTEGILLDYVYTGKGFSGLKDYITQGIVPKGSQVAFIHTGGVIGLFSDPDFARLLYE